MIEPKTITVDGLKFYLQPMPLMRAARLDKQVIALVLPVLNGLKEISVDAELDLSAITAGISRALADMDGDAFEKFLKDMLVGVQYMENGKAPQDLSGDLMDQVFQGRLMTLYQLLFEVMKFNKFSPFELVGGGNAMNKILSSVKPAQKQKKHGSGSAKSGTLLET